MAKILFVEDDKDIIASYSVLFENKGHKVVQAHNSKDGFDMAASEKPDLIIIDVMLEKEHSGFDLARKIRKTPEIKTIPLVMLSSVGEKTGMDFKQDAGHADWLPVDAYFDKTDQPANIIMAISSLLEKNSGGR